MIRSIIITENSFVTPESLGACVVSPLDRINVFIGPNNSGKSRLIRTILKARNREVTHILKSLDAKQNNRLFEIANILDHTLNSTERKAVLKPDVLKQLLQKKMNLISEASNVDKTESIFLIDNFIEEMNHSFFDQNKSRDIDFVITQFKNISRKTRVVIQEIKPIEIPSSKKIYIPILRGLRPLIGEDKTTIDVYSQRTIKDYFTFGNQVSVALNNVFTGLSMYEETKKRLLGTEEERNQIRDFEQFIGTRIFKDSITLIPKYDGDVLHIKVGSAPQRPIYELGDGLQSLLIILFPIFLRKEEETLVFIEEPEQHLHHSWQKLLVETLLCDEFKNMQYFISTHSPAFINADKTALFSVDRDANDLSSVVPVNLDEHKRDIVHALGFRPSDLLQANYLLFVEGPSDRYYISKLLKMHKPNWEEGKDYKIVVLGGNNFRHILNDGNKNTLEALLSINGKIGIILDSDKTSEDEEIKDPNKVAIRALFEEKGLFVWITGLREIENYIPYDIYCGLVRSIHPDIEAGDIKNGPYEDRGQAIQSNDNQNYKPTIKLSEEFFSIIQRNGDGTVQDISEEELRLEMNRAIQATAKNSIKKVDKNRVAEVFYRKDDLDFKKEEWPEELNEKLTALIQAIEEAN